jgi:hypothetical protein
MIAVKTAIAWCVLVGEDNSHLPSADEIEAHISRVESNACRHYAVTVNSKIELHACPGCSP